jgi:hypothetical protein
VVDTGDDEGTAIQSDIAGFVGHTFASGMFLEGEAIFSIRSNESDESGNNGLRDGRQIGLRFGKDVGDVTYEAVGFLYDFQNGDNEDEDDRSEGYGIGIASTYAVSNNFEIAGLLGYMGGGDVDGENEDDDVLDATTFISLQGTYNTSPEFSTSLRIDYVTGTAPDDDPDDSINGLAARLTSTYAFNDQLDVSAFIERHDWEQPDDDDDYQEVSFGLGVTYNFGPNVARSHSRIALPNAALWSANVAGHLK